MKIGVEAVSEMDGFHSLGLFSDLREALRFVVDNFRDFRFGEALVFENFKRLEFVPLKGEYYIEETSENAYDGRIGLVTALQINMDEQ